MARGRLTSRLKQLYTDPRKSSAAFSGQGNLYREAQAQRLKVSHKDIESYVHSNPVYTKHFPRKKKFQRRKFLATGIGTDFQIDLADMQRLKTRNRGFAYILCAVDVFSKMLYTVPIKKKTPGEVIRALKVVFDGFYPRRVYSDRGKEFTGRLVQEYMKENHIQHNVAQNDTVKAGVVENSIKKLKNRLYRYFSHTGKKQFLEILPHITDGLNHSYHQAIKMKPVEVTVKNQKEVFQRLYGDISASAKGKFKFQLGEKVRVLVKGKGGFSKGYDQKFSDQIYIIRGRSMGNPPRYQVEDQDDGTRLKRKYYQAELVRVTDWLEK